MEFRFGNLLTEVRDVLTIRYEVKQLIFVFISEEILTAVIRLQTTAVPASGLLL